MAQFNVGYEFSTGNSVVNQLPEGTLLEVVAPGRVQVADLPAKALFVGDRFDSKYGPATVVELSSRFADTPLVDDDEVLYIADGTTKVRRTARYI